MNNAKHRRGSCGVDNGEAGQEGKEGEGHNRGGRKSAPLPPLFGEQ